MKPKVQIIIMFLAGFVASALSGGAPIVLLILLTLLAAASFCWEFFDLTLKWPETKVSRQGGNSASSDNPAPALVLGIGHHTS
jgi:hypothetical protein